ncbi:MAG: hypothetical protein JWP85_70 [Rhodoglobus sp.]|nr:hypothetical protein [Rhodoglobus sp.]
MNPIVLLGIALAAPTPTPGPAYDGDPNLITPGVIGFAITFLIAVATVLLLLDMTRRVRRVRYRAEIREELDAEARDDELRDLDRKPGPPPEV